MALHPHVSGSFLVHSFDPALTAWPCEHTVSSSTLVLLPPSYQVVAIFAKLQADSRLKWVL